MRLLFIISSLHAGGAQRVLSNLVTNLPENWDIDILINSAEKLTYSYRGNLIDLKIKLPSDLNNIFYQFKVFVRRFSALRKLKKERSYTACISFLESANIVNVLTGNKYCKTILTVHNCLSQDKSFTYKCINSVIRFFHNHADCVVAVSKGVEYDLIKNLGVRKDIVTTIWNGFPLEEIKKRAGLRSERQLGKNQFTYITVGRCEQQKSQWHLVRAFAHLAKKYDDCRLVVLGEGVLMPYLEQLISAYKIEDSVSLKGFIDNPFAELINADAFVLPSLWEGLPSVIIEAMACSLPVIATDFRSGAREILAPDTDVSFEQKTNIELAQYGILTPVCSGTKHSAEVPLEQQEELLLDAMELMYSDEALRTRYCEASASRALDFSIEKCVEEWERLLGN